MARIKHRSVAGRALSRVYARNHTTRLRAEYRHLVARLGMLAGAWDNTPPHDFQELCVETMALRRKMVGRARTKGKCGTPESHYYAWLYTPEERRIQNLACGYDCTMPMRQYKRLDRLNGGRAHL